MTAHQRTGRSLLDARLSRRDAIRTAAGAAAGTAAGAAAGAAVLATVPAAAQTPVTFDFKDSGAQLPTEPVTLTWLENGSGPRTDFMTDLFAAYQQAHPTITVQYDHFPIPDQQQLLSVAIQNNTLPDVFQLGNTWVPEFVALRALAALDARVAGPGGVERADYFEGVWDTNVVDGATWGVPWYLPTQPVRDVPGAKGHIYEQ